MKDERCIIFNPKKRCKLINSKKSKVGLVTCFVAIFFLSFNCINIKTAKADVAVDIGDTIRWKHYLYDSYNGDILMTISNISTDLVLVVEGNVSYSGGALIDQGDLIVWDGYTLSIAGQASLLGLGGIGLLPRPLVLDALGFAIFSNYTTVGNTITEINSPFKWELTFNDNGILTVGKLFIAGVETYRLELLSSDGSIPLGFSVIAIFSTGIIFLVIKKKKSVKLV